MSERLYPEHSSRPVEQLKVSPTEAEEWASIDAWLKRRAGKWAAADCWACELGRICERHKPEGRERG